MKIGVFDSGLGGLTVLRALKRNFPDLQFIYLGDTARTPYGSRSADTIKSYALECSQFLIDQGARILVIACNTVSSIAFDSLGERLDIPILGTVDSIREHTQFLNKHYSKIGVIGTEATCQSGAYQRAIAAVLPEARVISKSCPLFVPLVEEGLLEGPIVERVVEHYLAELRDFEVEALILACTHYPLLEDAIGSFFGNRIDLIESADAISFKLQAQLTKLGAEGAIMEKKPDLFYVTDRVSKFNGLARIFLGTAEVNATKIVLGE